MKNYFKLISELKVKIWQKLQNFIEIWPKTVLFRKIERNVSSEKPCYLENRVVRETCKGRTALQETKKTLNCPTGQNQPNLMLYIIKKAHLMTLLKWLGLQQVSRQHLFNGSNVNSLCRFKEAWVATIFMITQRSPFFCYRVRS